MSKPQARIIELQRALKIAREALEAIRHGGRRDPHVVAADALYAMMPLEKTKQLQGLVGHEREARS